MSKVSELAAAEQAASEVSSLLRVLPADDLAGLVEHALAGEAWCNHGQHWVASKVQFSICDQCYEDVVHEEHQRHLYERREREERDERWRRENEQ